MNSCNSSLKKSKNPMDCVDLDLQLSFTELCPKPHLRTVSLQTCVQDLGGEEPS